MNLHQEFKFENNKVSKSELLQKAQIWINSGALYEKHIGQFIIEWFDDKDSIQVKTSGSTGNPKLININKAAMVASAEATIQYFNLRAGNSALLCLSAEFIAGKMMLVRAFVGGLNLYITEPSQSPLKKYDSHFDFTAMVPLQVEASLSDIHKVSILIIGGSSIPYQLKQKLILQTNNCYETYGMTETISHVAIRKLGEMYFKTLPNIQLYTDARGCLKLLVPYISNEPIQTNDIVELHEKNTFEWKGRIDDIINSGGFKIFPKAVEEKLIPFIEKPFFISKKMDEKLGEKVVLVIESSNYTIDESLFDVLHPYEKPKEIIFKEQFEISESGKILKKF